MNVKPRCVSLELIIWRYIVKRMILADADRNRYLKLEKGLAGELRFDALLEKSLQEERLVLNDLLFEKNHSIFQIDSLVIAQDSVNHFEIKNNEGDHYYDTEKFYTFFHSEINNPLHQMNRSATLLRQLLKGIGCTLPVHSYVIFINPEFTLYQSPRNEPIIYPTQVNRFLKEFNEKPSKLHAKHKFLADKLVSLHLTDNPYKRLPIYHYEQLKKGLICESCQSFLNFVGDRKVVCGKCGHEESLDAAVLRGIEEFMILFPEKRLTTGIIREWCGVVESEKAIRRILRDNFKAIGYGRWVYYE